MVKNEFFYPSTDGKTRIHAVEWLPDGEVLAVVQIAHGVAEYIDRYEGFARFLTERGFAVVGNDHLGHGKSVAEGAAPLRTSAGSGISPGRSSLIGLTICWGTPWVPSLPGHT